MSDLKIILERIDDCNKISAHCKKHKVVVQAGSHYGHYPERLAKLFDRVITFEADSDNFNQWKLNSTNIERYSAALGEKIGSVGIETVFGHDGQSHIKPDGEIPMVTIDSLNLDDCDLIYLDIEGYEINALKGALNTINKYSPVIAIERKKLIRNNGYGLVTDVPDFFNAIGYAQIAKYNLDAVYTRI